MAQDRRGAGIELTHRGRYLTAEDIRHARRQTTQLLRTHALASHSLPAGVTSQSIETDFPSNGSRSRSSNYNNSGAPDMGIKTITMDNSHLLQTVEIRKRPGQSLGFYIREGDGFGRQDGVFISRIQMGTVADSNGLLHVGDEILSVNKVEVSHMSLDDVVILMSIPKKLILKIRTKKHGHKKNASCPSLAMTEKEDDDEEPTPPIVVLKKGRSSSATALEETEKCPDLFEPEADASAATDVIGLRRHGRHDKQLSSQYASIFITPHKAEAKLLNEDGDSEHSSEGSLPRSIDSGGKEQYVGQRGYLSDSGYDPGGFYVSPSSLSPSQYGSSLERDYMKYIFTEGGLPRKFVPKLVPKPMTVTQQPPLPPRSFIGLSDSSDRIVVPDHYGAQQDYVNIRMLEQQSKGLYQGATNFREILHAKSRYNRVARARSPECYNSDSEVLYAPQRSHVDSRGFSSDYETYAGADHDDDPIYAVPDIPTSSSTELEELLRKFNSLSQELQEEQNKLHRQLSSRDKPGANSHVSLPKPSLVDYSSDEYASPQRTPAIKKPISPLAARRVATATQTPTQSRLARHSGTLEQQQPQQSHQQQFSHLQQQQQFPSYHHPHLQPTQQQKQQQQQQQLFVRAPTYLPDDDYKDGCGKSLTLGMHPISRGALPSNISTSSPLDKTKSLDKDLRTYSRPPASRFKDLQLIKKPLQIAYSEFEFYRADMRRRLEARTSGLQGLLGIHVLSGQGLKSSKMSLRDLYCVVSIDSVNKARTMIRTGAVNFDWDEAFDVELERAKEVSFLIYNWDPNTKHRLCFHGTVVLPGYVTSCGKKSIALKMEPKGLLYLTMIYKDPEAAFLRTSALNKNGVFGVDLETVIEREQSDENVPILVRKCVDEIERRGLEVAGIYRLCGSARRKAQLREAFEKNPTAVSLSAENVSDVHVITGILKDYLRELPEPVFTDALYAMLVDALSVRLPSDPDGSAKLMLSILECLPKVNQETMAVVLNHLKKITSKSEKNKMTCMNVAVCFGPLLLCPTSANVTNVSAEFHKHTDVLRYLLEIWPENYEMVKIESDSSSSGLLIEGGQADVGAQVMDSTATTPPS